MSTVYIRTLYRIKTSQAPNPEALRIIRARETCTARVVMNSFTGNIKTEATLYIHELLTCRDRVRG